MNGNILIVDDNQDNLRVLEEMLSVAGHTVRAAVNGEIAIRAVAANSPDLILLDVMMPGMDGYEVCRRLREDPATAGIPVLFLSALSETEEKLKAFEAGGVDYITKPFVEREVLARVQTHLRLTLAREELLKVNQELAKEIEERRQAELSLQEFAQALAQGHAELQQAYDRLRNAHAQLLQQEKMASLGQMAAGIAHEINTPTQFLSDNTVFLRDSLKEILAFLVELRDEATRDDQPGSDLASMKERIEALDLEYLLEEIPRAIQQSQEGVSRVSRIVLAMKDFAHPGTNTKAPMDINQAIENTITLSHNEWKFAASLETELDPGLPPVPGFLGEFKQVILNLLVNAAHAIKAAQTNVSPVEMGCIRVCTRREKEEVEIRITDTGSGIPQEIQSKIFEPFFTTKEVGAGTGLGLSIAYDIIVNKHGGSIQVTSEAGKGSTFIIRLALTPQQKKSETNGESTSYPGEKES
jgi:signal transduction histidine kinase